MEITEIRVALREQFARPGSGDRPTADKRLKAYVTLTFNQCFVVRNIKIIEGRNGLFVAMPSHKPKVVCSRCQFKNDLGGRFCSQCGSVIERPAEREGGSPSESDEAQAHRDIAHPITAEFRQYLQQKVLEAYTTELAKSRPSTTLQP